VTEKTQNTGSGHLPTLLTEKGVKNLILGDQFHNLLSQYHSMHHYSLFTKVDSTLLWNLE